MPAPASTRVLVITPDRVGARLAGIAMRHVRIAEALARRGFAVTLASTDRDSSPIPGLPFSIAGARSIEGLLGSHDAVVVQGTVLRDLPAVKRATIPLAVDLICPIFLENLERYRGLGDIHGRLESDLDLFREALQEGDFFFCGSPWQRTFWLGMLAALGRVNGLTSEADPSLEGLLAIVPFGIPPSPPAAGPRVLKGVVPGIGPEDVVFFWGGGLWDWLDPLTPIRAAAGAARAEPRVKLYFSGFRRPQEEGITAMAGRALELARSLDVLGRHVFFHDGWIPQDELPGYLLESDVGVSAHPATAETALAVRTRFWDYLWAGLPVLATEGDWASDAVAREGLGIAVPIGDARALAEGFRRLCDPAAREEFAGRVRRFAAPRTWDAAVEPLARFLAGPRRAADRSGRRRYRRFPVPGPLARNLGRIREMAAAQGIIPTLGKALGKARKTFLGRS